MDINKKIKKICKYFIKAKKYLKSNENAKAKKYLLTILKNISDIKDIAEYNDLLLKIKIYANKNILNIDKSYKILNSSNTNSSEKENIKNLIEIIEKGNIIELENILNNNKVNLNLLYNNYSPLHTAVKHGDCLIVKLLLQKKANINLLDSLSHTPLELACLDKNHNMINYLSKLGVNLKNQLLLRKDSQGKKLSTSNIESALIIKLIIENTHEDKLWLTKWEKINELLQIVDINKIIQLKNSELLNKNLGWNDLTLNNFLGFLTTKMNNSNKISIIKICIEELISKKCQINECNKIEIFLLNLIPILNLPLKIKKNWLLNYELQNLAKYLKKKHQKNFLPIFLKKIWKDYVENNIIDYEHLNLIIEPWIKTI